MSYRPINRATQSLISESEPRQRIAVDSDALRQCDAAISELLTVRGQLHLVAGNSAEAIAAFTQAITFDAKNATAYYGRSLARTAEENLAEADRDGHEANGLDRFVAARYASMTRLESGYRVMCFYGDGENEDPRPLGFYPHTPTGFRHATDHAKKLGRDQGERSGLDNRYQVDDSDFTASVQEFHTIIRNRFFVPPQGDVSNPRHTLTVGPDTGTKTIEDGVPFLGYWPSWGTVLDGQEGPPEGLTEQDAANITKALEAKVQERVQKTDLQAVLAAIGQLPEPPTAVRAVYNCGQIQRLSVTIERMIDSLWWDELTPLKVAEKVANIILKTMNDITNAVLADSQDLLVQVPERIRPGLTNDLWRFVSEVLVGRLASSLRQLTAVP